MAEIHMAMWQFNDAASDVDLSLDLTQVYHFMAANFTYSPSGWDTTANITPAALSMTIVDEGYNINYISVFDYDSDLESTFLASNVATLLD
jgi:hypothetical protein